MKNNFTKPLKVLPILLFMVLPTITGMARSTPLVEGIPPNYRFLSSLESGKHFQQQQEITGAVTDVNNIPIPGVPVMIKDTQRGTLTDKDGIFTITAAPENILVISYMGFETVELPIGSVTTFSVGNKNQKHYLIYFSYIVN